MAAILYHDPNLRYGFHISKRGTITNSIEYMLPATRLSAYQIYLSNRGGWKLAEADSTDILQTRTLIERHNKTLVAHSKLIHNLAGATHGPTDKKYKYNLSQTREGLSRELDIMSGLGGLGVVVHIGSSKDRDMGLDVIVKSVESVLLDETDYLKSLSTDLSIPIYDLQLSRKVILENSAGEGNKIGSTLDEIAEIVNRIDPALRDRVGVCLDTAHLCGAGEYDMGIPDDVIRLYDDFDDKIGLDRLSLFHLNDSRGKLGSKKDRHENLGLGHLFSPDRDDNVNGLDGLYTMLDMAKTHKIPMIGEPPAKSASGGIGPGGHHDICVVEHFDMHYL
jgi:deoxyribonuclease IV